MKKGLILLCGLLCLLWACTDSPTEPDIPGGGGGGGATGYTVTLNPPQGSAFITGSPPPSQANQVIEITATVRRDGAVVTDRLWMNFEILGTGAAFVETGTAHYSTYTANGAAKVTLYSTVTGTFSVKATVRVSDNASVNTTGTYDFGESTDFSITGVSPSSGSAAGGETVTIAGTGFRQPLAVYFGTQRAQFVSGTSTQITVTTPVHYPSDCNANDLVDVKVVLYPGQAAEASATLANAFNFLFEAPEPQITGIDPNHGTNNGGTLVTIYGSGFYCGEGVLVYFNQVAARVVSCAPDKIVVQTPSAQDAGIANCTESVGVRVLNLCGGTSYTLSSAFNYGPDIMITAWSPSQGNADGGTPVTIYGQGFDAPVAVALAGVGAQVVSVSNNELRVLSGGYDPQGKCGDFSGSIAVTDIECGVTAETANKDAWTYISPDLFISGLTPFQGVGGTAVTITGSGMIPPLEVFFGDSNANVVTVSGDYTSASVIAPPFVGEYDTLDCSTASGCPGTQAQPTPVTVKVKSRYTGCEYEYKSFFYLPPEDPANPGSGVAACIPDPPTCSISATAGTCSVTFNAEPVCGGTYAWTDLSGGTCVGDGTTTFVCTYTTSGIKSASIIITDEVGQATSCGATAEVEPAGACP